MKPPPDALPPVWNPHGIGRWRCATCGQQIFTAADIPLPPLCARCRQTTEWLPIIPLPTPTLVRWRCLNCGQQTFTNPDEAPPDTCAYCMDMTTWGKVD